MSFGSDNLAGASSQVLDAISQAYSHSAESYGGDEYCARAQDVLKAVFDTELRAYFVVTGTAANTLALSTMVQPWDGIVCHPQAHLFVDESTAPGFMTGGARLLPVPSDQLKIEPATLHRTLARLPNDPPHNTRAAVLSLSQVNECGQVYNASETAALCRTAKDAGLRVHMDGARFANALAALDCHPADISCRAGVDVLCLGATKNGAVAAEAVIFFDPLLAADFDYRLKRSGHLVSKSRLFGAQFLAWLHDDHWLQLARHANHMARSLRERIRSLERIRLAFECDANETFVIVQRQLHEKLNAAGITMYHWPPDTLPAGVTMEQDEILARLVTSHATQPSDIDALAAHAAT